MRPMLPILEEAAGSFTTTRWSLILGSSPTDNPAEKTRAALSELCQIYWKPVFCFILSRGQPLEDARDLTQDFFAMVLQGDFLREASESRGRFRSLLWETLQNFLRDARRREQSQKRGGGKLKISLEEWKEEQAASTMRSFRLPSTEHDGSRQFDLRWAAILSERARLRLRQECAANGRERIYSELSPYLAAEAERGEYETVAAVLGLRQEAVRVMVSRLRARYRALLREEVESTVEDPSEVKDELGYLFRLLASGE